MTPEEKKQFQDLLAFKKDMQGLLEWKKQMESSNSLPLAVDRALSGRGFMKAGKPGYPDPDFDYITNDGFRHDLALTGAAQTITVPSFPVRFIKLGDGSNLYIPLHTYSEFGL